jgi:hypothetical protein
MVSRELASIVAQDYASEPQGAGYLEHLGSLTKSA